MTFLGVGIEGGSDESHFFQQKVFSVFRGNRKQKDIFEQLFSVDLTSKDSR